MRKVGIIMGSDSDLPVVRKAADTLRALDIPYEAHVYSAHRTPEEASRFASQAGISGRGAERSEATPQIYGRQSLPYI